MGLSLCFGSKYAQIERLEVLGQVLVAPPKVHLLRLFSAAPTRIFWLVAGDGALPLHGGSSLQILPNGESR